MKTAARTKQIKVLMVEDNTIYANFIQEALSSGEKAEFEVDVCSHLSEGVSAAQTDDYNVILLDLGLPDSQGADTASSFRSQVNEDTPVVILTGEDDSSVALEALSKGEAWDYLPKHVTDLDKLQHAVCDAAR